jgi:hypothetical protein
MFPEIAPVVAVTESVISPEAEQVLSSHKLFLFFSEPSDIIKNFTVRAEPARTNCASKH